MAPRGYDRFMVAIELSSNGKVGRLTDREFRCLITGVWALAAKATPRGYLVVANDRATEHDVARQAHLPVTAARSTLKKLRAMEMLEEHPEVGFEYCHDWHDLNPDPKVDRTATDRKRDERRRKRDQERDGTNSRRDSHGGVTP